MIPASARPSSVRYRRSAVRCGASALLALALAVEPAAPQGEAPSSSESELDLQAGPRKHRKRQRRPIQMGTSGGNVDDITASFCCSGTLGGLVRKGNDLFILSNNHVIAKSNFADLGSAVSQPGLIDARCAAPADNIVGELTGFKRIKFGRGKNAVDAAIAAVVDDSVDASGAMIGIGVPGNEAVAPQIGMRVRKAGRTTGVRSGAVTAINVKVDVLYSEECSDDAAVFSARFVKQFFVESPTNRAFSAGGDSGAVIVENVKPCPRQVGLLFAGDERTTVGNPMSVVLKQVRKMRPRGPAELVGCNPSAAAHFEARAGILELGERELRLAKRIQAGADTEILAIDGVHAMGIGRSSTRPDAAVFKVYVGGARAEALTRIPRQIDGIPVEIVDAGPFFARTCPAGE